MHSSIEPLVRSSAPHWYAENIEDVLRALRVNATTGLTSREATLRYTHYGPNALPRARRLRPWQLILRQFSNPLIFLLFVAAALTLWIEEYADCTVIALAVLVNVAIGFWQEFQSSRIFEKLETLISVSASALRNGEIINIDMAELVPGDIIVLQSGTKVPADARILSATNLLVNEAILTGESRGVEKSPQALQGEKGVGGRVNMVHMGTVLERGEGRAVVVGTGARTEIGTIAAMTASVREEATPLQKRIGRLGRVLAIGIGVFALILFIIGLIENRGIVEMFKIAVAVAVAAIPEGLPAALSVVLAVSASRILRKKGLIKKLVAAETLGSTTVIVTDKTGTLTKGTMEVKRLISARNAKAATLALALSSDVVAAKDESGHVFHKGEETDKAKVEYFEKLGGVLKDALEAHPRRAFIPFDQDKKYVASFHQGARGTIILYVSGAPESILSLSHTQRGVEKKILEKVNSYAKRGFRMIAVGMRKIPKSAKLDFDNTKTLRAHVRGFTFLGVAAIQDPIRSDVQKSIAITRSAHVRVIMATGDHPLTALAIGTELGFRTESSNIITGEELDKLSDDALVARIAEVTICARVNPSHKMRLIDILRKRGEVVAMTGDGVNDAPALKAADIGVSLGSGTDVTKEAADLVLLDNSFTTISSAIREGRIAFDNIRKVTVFLLSNSFTELLIILASLVFKTTFLPITAVQILWANLVEDSFPNFALAFEPGEHDVMTRTPIRRTEAILDRQGVVIVFIIGILSDLILIGIFMALYLYSGFTPEHIQTLIFTLLATDSLLIVFAIKSYHEPLVHTRIADNKFLIFAVIAGFVFMAFSIYAPPLQNLLGTVPLGIFEVLFVLAIGVFELGLVEAVKWWFRHKLQPSFA